MSVAKWMDDCRAEIADHPLGRRPRDLWSGVAGMIAEARLIFGAVAEPAFILRGAAGLRTVPSSARSRQKKRKNPERFHADHSQIFSDNFSAQQEAA